MNLNSTAEVESFQIFLRIILIGFGLQNNLNDVYAIIGYPACEVAKSSKWKFFGKLQTLCLEKEWLFFKI